MSSKRDHHKYQLKQGNKIVYVGVTNDPERRENEHSLEGKKFTNMQTVGRVVTKDTALEWEQEKIDSYRKSHNGRKPRYNK